MSEKLVVDTAPFRFNVGDTVCQATSYTHWCSARADSEALALSAPIKYSLIASHTIGVPVPFKILERWTQECPGGVQKKYTVSGDYLGKCHLCLEHELESYDKILDNIVDRKNDAWANVAECDISWTKKAKGQWTKDQETQEKSDGSSSSENV